MVTGLQGAIIAAGRGDRLRNSAGVDIPKPLVELGGETMLARQARAMISAGASRVVAVINSETARLIEERRPAMPPELQIIVRDTANSMESLFTIGERLAPGIFVATTVDAVIPQSELVRFVVEAGRILADGSNQNIAGALAVTRWRGDKHPLFAAVTTSHDASSGLHAASMGLVERLGGSETEVVTAGVYFLTTEIFKLVDEARGAGLDALRRFLALIIERGMRLAAIEIEGAIDVDEASDLDAARGAIRIARRSES